SFLRNLGTLLAAHQGKKPAADFDAFCDGLDPFRDQPIGDFTRFLHDAAEYHRTGIVPVPARGSRRPAAGRPSISKQPLKRKDDVQAVEEAAASLQGLFDRATDRTLSHEMIESEVSRIEQAFDAEGLKAVARKFGITSGLSSKTAARAKILS